MGGIGTSHIMLERQTLTFWREHGRLLEGGGSVCQRHGRKAAL
jgi:hypothetical protein